MFAPVAVRVQHPLPALPHHGGTVQRLLDDAGHNIRLVKLGHGVHNINYATALLNVATDNCKKAGNLLDGNKTETPKTP